MLRFSIPSLALALGAGLVAQSLPSVASPSDRLLLEGSSFTHFPLGRHNARMQTLHADVPGGTLLTGHAYRRDAIGVRGLVQGLVSDLRVTLSMSPNPPTQASSAFANNVGPNPVEVLPRTLLAFPSTNRPPLDPAPVFELSIPYLVPFLVPPQGGTLCVDVEIFGNQTSNGANQNVSVFLDAHELYADGRVETPAFRTGTGCPAPGRTTPSTASLAMWVMPNGTSEWELSMRDGVPDAGDGATRAFVVVGLSQAGAPWPLRADCPYWTSGETWFAMPGTMNTQGDYDGRRIGMPFLPPGFRMWCQAGSVDMTNYDIAFTEALTMQTPAPGSVPMTSVRIVNSTNRTATTGTVSHAVPVIGFF